MMKSPTKKMLLGVGLGAAAALSLALIFRNSSQNSTDRQPTSRTVQEAPGRVGSTGGSVGGIPKERRRLPDPMHGVRSQVKRLTKSEKYWIARYPRIKGAWLARKREHQINTYAAQRNNLQPPPEPNIEVAVKEWLADENIETANPREIAPEFFDK